MATILRINVTLLLIVYLYVLVDATTSACDHTSPLQQLIVKHRNDSNGVFVDNIVDGENICLLAEESQQSTCKWQTLNLWNNNIGPNEAIYINRILLNLRLTYLHLGKNNLGSQGLQQLQALNKNRYLIELDLWDNKINDKAINILAAPLPTTILRKLNLGANYIGDKGCQVLFANLPSSLVDLNLFGNKISEKCLESISKAVSQGNLEKLNLQYQQGHQWSQKSQEELKRIGQYNSCEIII